jgi:hypothetical protein|nr:MAG TPA: hypothetical protein [Caudoviricetes sp.]
MDKEEKNGLEKIRDTLRETADTIDEILILDKREDNGEDVQKETEAALGRFTLKMIELQTLSQ